MIEGDVLYRAAAVSGVVAVVALIVAAVTIALFFGGAGEIYGPINDVFVAITAVALLLPIVAVDRLAGPDVGPWLRIVTVAALVGAIVVAVGQLSLVVGVIDLRTSFVTGGLGAIPILIWVVSVIVLAIPLGVLPESVGWLAVAAIALVVGGSIIVALTTGMIAWATWTAVVVALVLWLANLSVTFLDQVPA